MGVLDFVLDFASWTSHWTSIACAERLGFELLDFCAADAVLLKELPFHHRDPFDRMLIAQSLAQKTNLMSDDRRFGHYDCNLL